MSEELKNAVALLCKELKADEGYRMSWQANIAMFVFDACRRAGIDSDELHAACNKGASEFLTVLCIDRIQIDCPREYLIEADEDVLA